MHRAKLRLPSPATGIALLALFVALGGTAYAVKQAQIGSGLIKNNSVASQDLKNKGVKGVDVAPDALGGGQINEGALGAVPSATQAAQSAALTGSFDSGLVTATGGQTVPLVNFGPFTTEGRCTGVPPTASEIYMRTTVNGASSYTTNDEYDDFNFNIATPTQIGYGASQDNVAIYADYYDGFTAIAPGLTSIFRGQGGSALVGSTCYFIIEGRQVHP